MPARLTVPLPTMRSARVTSAAPSDRKKLIVSDADRWISTLRSSHERLVGAMGGMDDQTLSQPSMCSEWTIDRVLAHLGSGAEIARATLASNLEGAPPLGEDGMQAVWARWNALSGRAVVEEMIPGDRQLVERFEQLSDAEREEVRIELPFLPEPIDVASTVGFRLSEHALHSWDVFAALDPSTELAGDATELLVDRLPMMVGLLGRFTPRESRPAEDTTISVAVTDPKRNFLLRLGDAVELRPAESGRGPDGHLELPAEALIRLTAGRLKPGRPSADVTPEGRLTIDDLRRAFPGF
jgi:uncharacterized protein (TIGR03083 family)